MVSMFGLENLCQSVQDPHCCRHCQQHHICQAPHFDHSLFILDERGLVVMSCFLKTYLNEVLEEQYCWNIVLLPSNRKNEWKNKEIFVEKF